MKKYTNEDTEAIRQHIEKVIADIANLQLVGKALSSHTPSNSSRKPYAALENKISKELDRLIQYRDELQSMLGGATN